MKAKISKEVRKILSTSKGREQLSNLIKSGQGGSVDLGDGEIYKFTPNAGIFYKKIISTGSNLDYIKFKLNNFWRSIKLIFK